MQFRQPKKVNRTVLTVSKSRFICTVFCVHSVEEAKATISKVRSEMPDATHHVYAFSVGCGNSITEGMSDDGEPSGTAGPPLLTILRGNQIRNILAVVTRYYGGRKLGKGGLIRAYSDAIKLNLASLDTECSISRKAITLEIPYSLHKSIKQLIEAHQGTVENEAFSHIIKVVTLIPSHNLSHFIDELTDITRGQVTAQVID